MSAGPSLLGLYRPGTTFVHRVGVGPKVVTLAVLAVVATVLRDPVPALALVCVSVGLALWARIGVTRTLRAMRPILVVAAVLGLFQWWRLGPLVAVEVVADLLCLVLASVVVTATTPTDQVIEAITRACGPLRRFGVDPERVALGFALMLRAIPGIFEIAMQVREAAKARGLERHPRALLVPMALRTVARARATGDALAARGIGED